MHHTGAAGSCARHRSPHQPDHDRRPAHVSEDGFCQGSGCAAAVRRALRRLHQSAVSPMPFLAIAFPEFDPVAISLGPIAIRWYALAYIAGIVLGWQLMKVIARRAPRLMSDEQCDDFVVWCTLGIVLGGRIGHVIFYQPSFYLEHPLEIVMVWRGGMSFHGGLLGVFLAIWWMGRKTGVGFLRLGDVV